MSSVVVSWNLNHWQGSTESRARVWTYLEEELKADVALLQEAGEPPMSWNSVVAGRISDHREWATAIVSPHHEVVELAEVTPAGVSRAVALDHSIPGTAAFATVAMDGISLTMASLYGLMEPRNAYAAVNRQLADLSNLCDAPAHLRQTVVAGDLNLTSQWHGKDASYAPIDRSILEQFQTWGLRNLLAEQRDAGRLPECPCDEGEECRHVETWFPRNRTWPHQNDYLFLSKRFDRPVTVTVDTRVVHELKLSDHAALVLTIG